MLTLDLIFWSPLPYAPIALLSVSTIWGADSEEIIEPGLRHAEHIETYGAEAAVHTLHVVECSLYIRVKRARNRRRSPHLIPQAENLPFLRKYKS